MALFCTITRLSPADYRSLTMEEYMAFLKVLEERNGAPGTDEWPTS